MRKLLRALFGLLLAGSLTAQTTPPLGIIDKTPELQAFTNARIFASLDEVLDSATLVIDRGKIIAVGNRVAIPTGAVVVDLEGKTIYPGFIEPLAEYGLNSLPEPERPRRGQPPVYEAVRIGCNSWNSAVHPEYNWVDKFRPDSTQAKELRQMGFTSAQSAHMDGIFRGRGFVVSLGEGLPNDLVIRPYAGQFMSFDKGSSPMEYPTSQMGAIALIRQTILDADWYQKAQAAYQKNPQQERPEANLALEALRDVKNRAAIFQTPDVLAMLRADRLARELGLDAVLVASGFEFERIDEIKAAGRTLIVPVNFPEAPEVKSLGDELDVTVTTLRRWDWAPSNPAVLEENGIRFAFTTDGLKKHDEFMGNVRRAIKRGLSEKTALAALTTIPAEICGVSNLVGTLASGKLADFVVCNGNMFDEKTNLYAVYTHGRKTEFIPYDETDFSGYYIGELVGRQVGLKLEDKGHSQERKTGGRIKSGETRIELTNVSAQQDQITFSARLDSLGGQGVARFALRKSGDRLTGRVGYADGRWETWSVTAGEEPPSDSSETDKEEKYEESPEPIARLTYPNMAYGFETPPQQENVLVKNGTVWTCEAEGILENTDVLIRNGRIEAIGRNLSAPPGYRIIDAAGKHVTPGVIDEHSHMCISGDVNEGSDAISSEVRIADVVDPDDISIYRSLAGGVTAARTLHGSANPIGGQAQIIKLRWSASAEEMKFAGAPPSIKFALGENVRQVNWGDQFTIRYPQSRMGVETIIRDAFQAACEYEAKWKTYNALSAGRREKTIPPRRDLRLEALVEVLNSRMFITCHSYVQSEILMLMRVAEQFGIKISTFTHILEGYKVADEMARHGAAAGSAPDWWAYKFEVYDAIPQNPGIMHEHGVVVSINSDSPQLQRLLNQAAAKSVEYTSMSQEDALKMVTINPARQLKADQHIGSLKIGKDADFVIWSGNPLSVYSLAEQTWIDGRKYFDTADDLVLRRQLSKERNQLIQKVLDQPERDKDHRGKGWKNKWEPHAEKGAGR